MADFTMITVRLATGAALTGPDDVRALQLAGITHVIDCRAEMDDAPLFADSGLTYLWNPTEDDGLPKPAEWFARSLDFALPALARPRTRVLTHCAAGVNRGPSTAYAILRALGLTPDIAETLIRTARPQVGLAYQRDADQAINALGYA